MQDGEIVIHSRATASSAFAHAVLAGFVASVAMVLAFALAFLVALVLQGLPVPLLAAWFHGLTNNALLDIAGPNLYAATAVFFGGGLLWAVLYGLVFESRLRGTPWERGVLFALIPWLFSLAIFLPLVGGGLLGLDLGAGPLPVLGNLILHLVYGAVLGTAWAFGSAEARLDRPPGTPEGDDLHSGRRAEIGAAQGMVVGIVLGALLGAAGGFVPQITGTHALGMNPLALVVGVGLTGAAFGSFVGSLSAS
jgi:hypothetical protein